MVLGEILLGKAGGVELDAKKTPCERLPLLELQLLHAVTMFSISMANSGALLIGMM